MHRRGYRLRGSKRSSACLAPQWAPIAIALLAATWSGPAWAQLLSPGDLARVHEQLSSDADCTRCHESGRRVAVSLCVDCHDDIGRKRAQRDGLHGTRYASESCGHCHVEHRGRDHALVRWPGGSQAAFEHGTTGFSLEGAHAEAECRACHERRNRRGAVTFLGAPETCHGCHQKDDVHKGRFGKRCGDCHDARTFKGGDLDRLDHDLTRFALAGAHARVECKQCHGEPARYRGLSFESCKDCHADPHKGRLGDQCSQCHRESDWAEVRMRRAAHPGLRIDAGHADVACNACHDQGRVRPPSAGTRCVDCHRPVHEARFGTRCEGCHRSVRWLGLPERTGRKVHDQTAFALLGAHATVACADCHRPEQAPAQRFRGLSFERCRDCHEDVHGGRLSRYGDGDCQTCHDEHGFAPTLFTVEQHEATHFPLLGRHVAIACRSCHRSESPRLDWSLDQAACADCHQNPHGDQFARELATSGCAGCHSPVAWNAPNIDHSTWPLTGAHELVACAACHDENASDRRAGGGASYRGVPRACDGCHADPHLGQFRLSEPVRACDACHATSAFTLPEFDHTEAAGYGLEGKHAALACDGCHGRETLRDGQSAVRYRLGYRACRDCHADPHAPGAGGAP